MPILVTLHVIVCVMIILVVLMQRPRSEGLGAAFGGGVTENLFGAQTSQMLAKFTTWLAVAFFGITLLLSILTAKGASGKTDIQKSLLQAPIPQASATPSPVPSAAPEATPTAAPSATPAAAPSQAPSATPSSTTAQVAPPAAHTSPSAQKKKPQAH